MWTCNDCKFVYKGYGLPNRCPECGKREWDIPKRIITPEGEVNPLDAALEKLNAYEKDCEPRTLLDIEE